MSRSLATSRVPALASTSTPPERCTQFSASCRPLASARSTPAGEVSKSESARAASHSASLRQSIRGVLAPTPRGSNPTTSNGPPPRVSPIWTANVIPDPPGPPGLSTSDPIFGWSARCRSTATCPVRPPGAA